MATTNEADLAISGDGRAFYRRFTAADGTVYERGADVFVNSFSSKDEPRRRALSVRARSRRYFVARIAAIYRHEASYERVTIDAQWYWRAAEVEDARLALPESVHDKVPFDGRFDLVLGDAAEEQPAESVIGAASVLHPRAAHFEMPRLAASDGPQRYVCRFGLRVSEGRIWPLFLDSDPVYRRARAREDALVELANALRKTARKRAAAEDAAAAADAAAAKRRAACTPRFSDSDADAFAADSEASRAALAAALDVFYERDEAGVLRRFAAAHQSLRRRMQCTVVPQNMPLMFACDLQKRVTDTLLRGSEHSAQRNRLARKLGGSTCVINAVHGAAVMLEAYVAHMRVRAQCDRASALKYILGDDCGAVTSHVRCTPAVAAAATAAAAAAQVSTEPSI